MLDWLKQNQGSKLATVAGTSYAAEYVAAICARIAMRVKELVPKLERSMRPKVLKTVLEEMAQPIKDSNPLAVGKGVVTVEIAERYLAMATPQKLADICHRAEKRW